MMGMIFADILHELPIIIVDVAIALLPVVGVFIIFQLTLLKLPKSRLIAMGAGMVYAYIGLIFFFLGVDIGFSDTGTFLGESIGSLPYNWILIPIGLLIGFSVVLAEPAVRSLAHQVTSVSGGMIHQMSIYASLCVGVSVSVALAMIRALWGINIWFFILPGYITALILAKYSPPMFTAIAFDAGGVATGPMTATFVLSFAIGVTTVIGKTVNAADAFGVVALVAMTPLITIQILGLLYQKKTRMAENILQNADNDDIALLLDENEDDVVLLPEEDHIKEEVSHE